MAHLCEPSSDGSDKFMDGIPKENMPRQGLLNRIGVMELINQKVREFRSGLFAFQPLRIFVTFTKLMDSGVFLKTTQETKKRKPKMSLTKNQRKAQNRKPKRRVKTLPKTVKRWKLKPVKLQKSPKNSRKRTATHQRLRRNLHQKRFLSFSISHLVNWLIFQNFMFNIADGGFTELHTLWMTEEDAALNKARKINEIWHR